MNRPHSAETTEVIHIQAGSASHEYYRDIWRYRELLFFLAWRDILVHFKQTVVGIAWCLIRPTVTLLAFAVVFGKIAKLPSPGAVPYVILVAAALVPWQLFASSMIESGSSILGNANLISKVYFPRLIIPASTIVVCLVDALFSAGVLLVLMAWYGFWPSWQVVALPLFLALAMLAAFGAGLWLSALTVKYRDFRYIVPFLVQIGLYISPVGYSSEGGVIPAQWRLLFSINPMVGVIDGFRWSLFAGATSIYWPGMALSLGMSLLLLCSGLWYFRKTERSFADYL